VVDWADVTFEPRQASVALFRHLLSVHPGGEAPGEFLAAYRAAAGVRIGLDDMASWDVLYGLRGIGPVAHWAHAYKQLDVALTADDINERSRRWVTSALTRCRVGHSARSA
jgi:hypothetical protein